MGQEGDFVVVVGFLQVVGVIVVQWFIIEEKFECFKRNCLKTWIFYICFVEKHE